MELNKKIIIQEKINQIARIYATAPASIIFWGMGISQHVHGTDNARALISLSLMTGQIGKPGTGLHPLRGQNLSPIHISEPTRRYAIWYCVLWV